METSSWVRIAATALFGISIATLLFAWAKWTHAVAFRDVKPPGAKDCEYAMVWGPCSEDCGVGVQHKHAQITQQATEGGSPCPPVFPEPMTRTCMVKPCSTSGGDPHASPFHDDG